MKIDKDMWTIKSIRSELKSIRNECIDLLNLMDNCDIVNGYDIYDINYMINNISDLIMDLNNLKDCKETLECFKAVLENEFNCND